MADLQVTDVIQRLGQLKSIRQPYEDLWHDITDFVLPRRSFWDIDAPEGQKPATKIYDTTSLIELQELVDGIIGNMVSVNIRWLHLLMEDARLNEMPWVRDWLEDVENAIYAELERSNFYSAISQYFQDGASIGTAIMTIDDDVSTRKIVFSVKHIAECYIAEGRDGMVDTLYRTFKLTNRRIMQMWGDNVSKERYEQYKRAPFQKGKIIHAIFPRAEYDPERYDSKQKAFASIYIDHEYHNEEFLSEKGFDDFPAIVWRWRKNSNESYGRSPAGDSIGETLRLNQMGRTSLTVAQMNAQPPLMIPETMKGQERIVPDGHNYYTDPKSVIQPLFLGQNYSVSKEEQMRMVEQIKAHFRTKLFTLMSQLENGPYTATEINARQGEQATLESPMIGGLNAEAMIPLIARVFRICQRNGKIPLPPPGLEQGGRIRIEFQGPLANKAKKYHQSQGIDAASAFIDFMQEKFPETLDNLDGDEFFRQGMDSKGAPQKTIRETPQVQEIRKIRQAQQEKAQKEAVAMEQQKMLADNANKLNEPVKKDSMLAGIAAATAPQQGNARR